MSDPRSPAARAWLGLALLALAMGAPTSRPTAAQSPPHASLERELSALLMATTDEWNRGNLDGFMAPYDGSTTFMTGTGLIGRDALRARYARNYFTGTTPDQQLRFDELAVRPLGAEHALMTGRFLLSGGAKPEQTGRFSLVWGRTPAGWRILHDHSS